VSRGDFQERQYEFPYHYVPHFDARGRARRSRNLGWGFEYLCYQEHVRTLVDGLRPRSIIEVGCGDGRLIGSLSAAARRVGVDISSQAIAFARAFHPDVEFSAADAATISEQFDAVLAIEVLEHIPDENVDGFLKLLETRCEDGGHVVISVPSQVLPVNKKHYRHYTAASLEEQLRSCVPGLALQAIEHVYAPPAWLSFFLRATCNRFITVESPLIDTLLWRYVWRRARIARAGRGQHIVAVLRKPAPG
jgi:SAM-dependent methyltransferase